MLRRLSPPLLPLFFLLFLFLSLPLSFFLFLFQSFTRSLLRSLMLSLPRLFLLLFLRSFLLFCRLSLLLLFLLSLLLFLTLSLLWGGGGVSVVPPISFPDVSSVYGSVASSVPFSVSTSVVASPFAISSLLAPSSSSAVSSSFCSASAVSCSVSTASSSSSSVVWYLPGVVSSVAPPFWASAVSSFPPSSSFLSLPSSSSHRVFKQVVSLITGFFPAAKPKDVKPADSASWFEGFGDVKRCDPRFFLFFLFNKLRSIKVEVDSKVQKSAHNRKKAIGVLPSWGDVYHVSDLPEFHKAPPLNKQFSRLLDKMVASSRFMSMSIEECMKLESLVGVMSLSTDNQRLSVAQLAGVERQGCGSLGSGGLAFGISHSLSCGPHTIQGTHPLSFVLPLVHQGQSTGCGSAISCRGGSSGACSSSVSVVLW